MFLAMIATTRIDSIYAQSTRDMTKADIERLHVELSNWGRWGADDQLGTLNLITPERRKEAARLVREGISLSLARNAETTSAADNPSPFEQVMLKTGGEPGNQWAMDNYSVSYHGVAHTHMDSLCHLFYRGKMYNGYPASEVKSTGAKRNSIMCAKEGIVSRGVLLDIPRLLGRPWLEPCEAIDPEHLAAAEKAQGVTVEEGDILLVATGRDARREAKGRWSPVEVGMPGLHVECIPWLHERGISILGSDVVSDVLPGPCPGTKFGMPIHQCTLVAMGVHLLDNLHLGSLMSACAELSQWEFQLTVAPLRIEGGTGSPVNPIALL